MGKASTMQETATGAAAMAMEEVGEVVEATEEAVKESVMADMVVVVILRGGVEVSTARAPLQATKVRERAVEEMEARVSRFGRRAQPWRNSSHGPTAPGQKPGPRPALTSDRPAAP